MKELDYTLLFEASLRSRRHIIAHLIKRGAKVEDAEDATHDAIYKAIQKFSSFRGESRIETWLIQIAWHQYLKFYSRERNKTRLF